MKRIWMASVASVICALLVAGCEKASSAAKKIEEGAKLDLCPFSNRQLTNKRASL